MSSDNLVEHQPESRRFVISMQGEEAVLRYSFVDERTVDYYSTFVPPSRRGEGIGSRLVEHALEWARRENYLVRASCPFVDAVLRRHKSYADLRA
ncbi:MAG TPA: GNAT family N-acetyltransferase [Acidobacteriota bacterium]|nr:GNAT family N-acetyltransferase [Acidobacteriota bacterium]